MASPPLHVYIRLQERNNTTFLDKLDELLTDLGNDSILVGDCNFDLNNINATSTSMNLDLITWLLYLQREHDFNCNTINKFD
jgi:hypothetical protein